jgi:hypothetical protein
MIYLLSLAHSDVKSIIDQQQMAIKDRDNRQGARLAF